MQEANSSYKYARPDPMQTPPPATYGGDNAYNYSRVNDTYDWLNATQPDQSMGPIDKSQDFDHANPNYRSIVDEHSRDRDYDDTVNDSVYQRVNGRAGEGQGYEDVRRYKASQP